MRQLNPHQRFYLTLAAGLISGFVFIVSIGKVPGIIFLALLPLFTLGLAFGANKAAQASGIAFSCVCVVAGAGNGIFCALFLIAPGYYFLRHTLLWRQEDGQLSWYPMLKILTELTILSAAALSVIAIATGSEGGLQAVVKYSIGDSFKPVDPELAAEAQEMMNDYGFAIFALAGWIWVLILYGLAILANALLKANGEALRPSLALNPHGLPAWLLALVAISGGLALIGHGQDRFTAESVFLLLLLPYSLSGIAYMHHFAQVRMLRFRRLWITCLYIALIFGHWPIAIMIGIGLYLQLVEILDRHKKMG